MFREKAVIMDCQAMSRAITRISFEIIERNKGVDNICICGVYRRGVVIAKAIAKRINELEGKKIDIGTIDATMHRDDIDKSKVTERCKTDISFDINNKTIILVDDVLFTGRTIRAAIDAVMDLGRPKSIQLAVLIDRGHRELPIRPDYIGKNVPTSRNEKVKVLVTEYDNDNKVIIGDEI